MSLTLDRERLGYRYEGPVLSRCPTGARDLGEWIERWRDSALLLLALDHSHVLAVPSGAQHLEEHDADPRLSRH